MTVQRSKTKAGPASKQKLRLWIRLLGTSRTIEAELREKLALLTLIADGTNRAVVVTDRRLKTLYTNAAFTGMFGYSLEEAQGRQVNALLVGRHTNRRALARLRRQVDEEGGGEEPEGRHLHRLADGNAAGIERGAEGHRNRVGG